MEVTKEGLAGIYSSIAAQNGPILVMSESHSQLASLKRRLMLDKRVDCFDHRGAQSNLSIEEYLSFYGIANSVYGERYVEEVKRYLIRNGLFDHYETPVSDLTLHQQLLVRMFITEQKSADVLVIDNINGEFRDEELFVVIQMLWEAAQQCMDRCIIMTAGVSQNNLFRGKCYRL